MCYQEIHSKEDENNDDVHCRFLDKLKSVLPFDTPPIIVTDAIFSTLWFKKVIDLGWNFVGRVRTNRGNYFYQDKWRPVREAYQLATNIPNSVYFLLDYCLFGSAKETTY